MSTSTNLLDLICFNSKIIKSEVSLNKAELKSAKKSLLLLQVFVQSVLDKKLRLFHPFAALVIKLQFV